MVNLILRIILFIFMFKPVILDKLIALLDLFSNNLILMNFLNMFTINNSRIRKFSWATSRPFRIRGLFRFIVFFWPTSWPFWGLILNWVFSRSTPRLFFWIRIWDTLAFFYIIFYQCLRLQLGFRFMYLFDMILNNVIIELNF